MPEKKYIEADRAFELIKIRLDALELMTNSDRAEGYEMAICAVLRIIEHAPTADVAEVRHSVWVYLGIDKFEKPIYQCKNCKCNDRGTPQYCPNCGARMDGGTNTKHAEDK